MKLNQQDWLSEFDDFMKTEAPPVPSDLNQKVFQKAHQLLNPSAFSVFAKILGLHLLTGYMSLVICHQFDMNPFNTTFSLDQWFMTFTSHEVCMVLCGSLFVSATIIVAGSFMSVEEVKSLKKHNLLQNLSIGLISIGLFLAFGAQLVLSFTVLWLLGFVIGGVLTTKAIWYFRTYDL